MKTTLKFIKVILIIGIIISCKKTDTLSVSNNDNFSKPNLESISKFLDLKSGSLKDQKKKNIELLKKSLEFERFEFVIIDEKKSMIIVPLSKGYSVKMNVAEFITPVLILTLDKGNNIQSGNILLIKPANSRNENIEISEIADYFKTGVSKYNGEFHFLSLAGKRLYQMKYKDNKLQSYGIVKQKAIGENKLNSTIKREANSSSCIDWYIVTTYYWNDGSTYTTEEFIGTTCDACVDNSLESICPDTGGGGGGGSGDADDCFQNALNDFENVVSGGSVTSMDLYTSTTEIDDMSKYKTYQWVVLNGFGGFKLISSETAKMKKLTPGSFNDWSFVSLTHNGIEIQGSSLPGTAITYSSGIGTPSFTPETAEAFPIYYGNMALNFRVTYTFICDCQGQIFVPAQNLNYHTISPFWKANP